MIEIGQLVRVMNAVHSDSILVGRVINRHNDYSVQLLEVRPAFGPVQWVRESDCDVLRESDL